ncbi:MAG: glutamate 5-kinase [Victivallaceae bacterium]
MDQAAIRKELLGRCRQIIVKAGTRLLSDHSQIARLVEGIAEIRARGCRALLVTSGAVGMGMRELGLAKRPRELSQVQALAAIGQCKLMAIYEEECRKRGFKSAQLLLNTSDLKSRERYLNVMNCINALWDNDVLPIINENDSVSVDELKFGDNDTLAGMLGTITGAQLTIILTTEQGLRERVEGKLGKRIPVVAKLDQAVKDMAGGTDNAEFSIGGMASKLKAAELVTSAGEYLWIADGREEKIINRILDGEDVGTLFVPGPRRVPGHKRYLRYFAAPAGSLVVDAGAAKALRNKGGSLLPSGIVEVRGSFKRGNSVEIIDAAGTAIARGLVNYASSECDLIKGLHSSKLEKALGHTADTEVVHRDNLSLL